MDSTQIILSLLGSGGIFYLIFERLLKIMAARQQAQAAIVMSEQQIKAGNADATIKDKEKFQEQIMEKLIHQLLEQFSSYKMQNENFQKFFFERLDPLLRAVVENSDDIRKSIAQGDLSTRGMRELTESNKQLEGRIHGLLSILPRIIDHPDISVHTTSPVVANAGGSYRPRKTVNIRTITNDKEDSYGTASNTGSASSGHNGSPS